jgi:predicted LPLAT superfamily acyltransferase
MVQGWTGKSRSKNFFHNLMILIIKFGALKFAYFIGRFVAFFYCLLPSVRKNASYYLEKKFPNCNHIKKFLHLYKLNLTFGKILIDRAIFGIKSKVNIISSRADINLCKSLYQKNNGLIILSAHCGCWQSAMSAFNLIDDEKEKYVVYHQNKEDIDKHVHQLQKKESPVKFIEPNAFDGGIIEIMAALQRGSLVCMMGDRVFGASNNFVEVNFLGAKIALPFSIYRIAATLNKPIAIIFFPYKKTGAVDTMIADYFFVKDGGKAAQNYVEYADRFSKALENFVKVYPYQFYNYFNLWRK